LLEDPLEAPPDGLEGRLGALPGWVEPSLPWPLAPPRGVWPALPPEAEPEDVELPPPEAL